MAYPAQVRVVLDLYTEPGAIRGLVSRPGQPSRPFHGWLELANALENARIPADDQRT